MGEYSTDWQRLEVETVTGSTVSVMSYQAMNLLVKSAEVARVQQPATRAFMDDMTMTARSIVECRWMIEDLEKLVSWARMEINPAKSRTLVLEKGRVLNSNIEVAFQAEQQPIPTVSEQPVKSLGKCFIEALNDKSSTEDTIKQDVEWMERVC